MVLELIIETLIPQVVTGIKKEGLLKQTQLPGMISAEVKRQAIHTLLANQQSMKGKRRKSYRH